MGRPTDICNPTADAARAYRVKERDLPEMIPGIP